MNPTAPIVLVVDDTRANQEVLVHLLSPEFRVKVAGNGTRALEVAAQAPQPDIILLDVIMPEMDGYEVIKRLKANPATHEIPVIFVTAATDNESESQGLQLGAADYITKPINPDITLLRVRNQLLLRQSLSKLRLTAKVFENTLEGITITDANKNIVDVNPAFTRITGYAREEVLGRNPQLLSSGHMDKEFYERMWHDIYTFGHWSGEILDRRKDGEAFPEWLSISAVTDAHGGHTHYVGIFSDISLRKHHEKELERIAHYDALTGIPNRVLLADRMKQAVAQAKRDGEMLGVCYLDLDGFKPVNDTLGHQAGDQVLVEITKRIGRVIREGDTVARLGGDEFVVLLVRLDGADDCMLALDRLLAVIAEPITVQGRGFNVTASIGASIFPFDDNDPDVLLRHADQAMYLAKQDGKNRYHIYDPGHDLQARHRRELLVRIEKALQGDEFELYFQPKMDLHNGVIVGAEALLRWNHPEFGVQTPGEFLPGIAHSPLEIELGNWVLDRAIATLFDWHASGLDLEISVNIGAAHLQAEGFVERLRKTLGGHPAAGRLQIEILETAALADYVKVTSVIEACQAFGVSFALDDFGTGYSSLAYLRNLPAKTLKIDQTFVRDMLIDKGDHAIVQGVIALASTFERETVAEGVETDHHLHTLAELGCRFAQGYGIAQPMPAAAFIAWLQGRQDPASAVSAGSGASR